MSRRHGLTVPVLTETQARSGMCAGMAQLAAVLARTLGPDAGTVISAETGRHPELLTSSGILARRIVELPDRCGNIGAMLIRQAVWRMHDQVGDGGAITAALTYSLTAAGCRALVGGADSHALRRGLRRGLECARAALQSQSRPVDPHRDLPDVLRTAFGDSDLVARLAEMCAELGPDGHLEIRNSATGESSHRMIPGGRWSGSIITPELPARELVLADPYVLVTDHTISESADIARLLDSVLGEDGGPLLIIAKDLTGPARRLLGANRGIIQVATGRLAADSHWLEHMEDLAVATRARFIARQFGDTLAATTVEDLGYAQHARLRRDTLEILGGGGDPQDCAARSHALREIRSDDVEMRDCLSQRIGNLTGRNAVLSLGAGNDIERAMLRETAERAVRLAAVAGRDGVVAGGCVALSECRPALDSPPGADPDERLGLKLLRDALDVPRRQIARHRAGPHQPGILDSAAVLIQALETAVSTAGTALTSGAVVLSRTPEISLVP